MDTDMEPNVTSSDVHHETGQWSSSETEDPRTKKRMPLQKRAILRNARAATTHIDSTEDDMEDDEYESRGEEEEEDDDDDDHAPGGKMVSPMMMASNQHHNNINSNNSSHFLSDSDADYNPLTANIDTDDDEVPLVRLFQKFLNREALKSLKLRHSQLNSKLQRLRKVVDNVKIKERGQQLKQEKDKIKELIKLKKTQLNDKMNAPPFLRLMDKVAFTLGLIVLLVSEFVLLRVPEFMYLWYTVLILPLMAIRFVMYHRAKYHYFMLDFCYLCQFLLLFYMFGHQYVLGNVSPAFFKLVFALSNGPLAWGCIVWRNSMVFHDVDKLTSVFIHLCPPIVTYCLRWYPIDYPLELACGGASCALTYSETYLVPIYLYTFWQVLYYVKTEVIDEIKLADDPDIMTSSRWMSIKQPHPIYKALVSKGINVSPVLVLMLSQLVYTLGTLITLPLMMQSFVAHSLFLFFILVTVSWNGANYYFEVFSENYNKRFKSDIAAARNTGTDGNSNSSGGNSNGGMVPCNKLKITSIFSFAKFITVFLALLICFLKLIL
ncbi:hypothetical protein SAMD00019534_051490 [Acytostelium subglobosum LB1]|uniref:hypothetical protein n=1 Tax=Acytostelium subglobosum LB1 TaxID=1410327 RepID=UPI000644A5EF|nr:hypothetical protein SAMD00019534_051490 [Acytostelium subglobosum LB1]GAM21974.1 hypothetical protein SAMD00019534_051490 [Acytostelium subglobosum LB1]|eukprot:XP_012755074.1 hypothetical protein SAMD00019534_051490 [Acytostelium subglobosum LB1]